MLYTSIYLLDLFLPALFTVILILPKLMLELKST